MAALLLQTDELQAQLKKRKVKVGAVRAFLAVINAAVRRKRGALQDQMRDSFAEGQRLSVSYQGQGHARRRSAPRLRRKRIHT